MPIETQFLLLGLGAGKCAPSRKTASTSLKWIVPAIQNSEHILQFIIIHSLEGVLKYVINLLGERPDAIGVVQSLAFALIRSNPRIETLLFETQSHLVSRASLNPRGNILTPGAYF